MTKKFGKVQYVNGRNMVINLDEPFDEYTLRKFSNGHEPTIELNLQDGRTITNEQRKKVFAMLNDVSAYTGFTLIESEQMMKFRYMAYYDNPYFSLSDTSVNNASHFIEFLIVFCFQFGIPFKWKTYETIKSSYRFQRQCVLNRRCIIDGQAHSDIHHLHAVGMGRNRGSQGVRNTNLSNRFTCLCRKHHTEIHTSKVKFEKQYHIRVAPVQLDQDELKKMKVGY